MSKGVIGAVIVFSLLLLAFTQAAQSPQVDILKQYQKIQSEAKNYRLFSYDDGAPKGSSYESKVDNFGYLWIATDYTQIHRFNGSSFMDILAQLPATERDSLLSYSLTQDNEKRIYLVGKHYLYRWNGYKLLKYAFPKDDRIREYREINGKLLAVGNNGYAVLNYDKWIYTRIPIKHYKEDGTHNIVILTKHGFYSPYKSKRQDFCIDNHNRLYQMHYDSFGGTEDGSQGLSNSGEDFSISRYSAAGIETLPCLTQAERYKLFFQNQLEFSPVFRINPQSEVSIVFAGTEHRFLWDLKKGAFRLNTLPNSKLLSCSSYLGEHRKVLTYSRADTLFIKEFYMDVPLPIRGYYYPNFRSDRNYRIAFENDWLFVNEKYSQQTVVLKIVPGLSYMNPVSTPELNSGREYATLRETCEPMYEGNKIVYTRSDPKLSGVHSVYLIDVETNSCQTLQVADNAPYLSVLDYNVNNNSILVAGKEGILLLSLASVVEKQHSYDKINEYSIPTILHTKWGVVISIFEWDKDVTRLLINSSGSIKELQISGFLRVMHASNEQPVLKLLIHGDDKLREERINLTTGKVISQSSLDKLQQVSSFNVTAFYLNKDLTFSLQSSDSTIAGNVKAITQPWNEILDTQRIVRDDLPESLTLNLVDEETVFLPSSEYLITSNENGFRALARSDISYEKPPLPPDKVVLSGNPPDKFLTAALLYNCKTNKVYEKPNWVRAFTVQDKWIDKTKIVYVEKQKEGKALRISDYQDKELKTDNRDFVLPLSGNYLPNYELFIDYDCYFPLIDKMLYYRYKGVWDKLVTGDNPQYGELKSVNRDNNDLWLVYENALIRFSLLTQQSFVFTSRHGLPEDLLDMYEVASTHYLVTRSGIYSFAPQEEGSTLQIPWLTVNGTKFAAFTMNKFSYKQNSIIIPVDILNSMFPERIKLNYRLLGYEKDWKQRDYSPQIEYPKLPPGHYEFQINATSPTGLKSKTVSLFIIIKPPVYGTWWAYLIYSFALLYLGRYLYRLRTRQLTARNEALENTIAIRTSELREEQQRIKESIQYAALIQKSILPQAADLAQAFRENFVIWQPRDIVGGDFYWMHTLESGEIFFAVIDCTGHGVPGALLSMTVNSLLSNLIRDRGMQKPSEVLTEIHREMGKVLHQEREHAQQDGLEIALVRIDKASGKLVFSGAGLHLLHYNLQSQALQQIRGDRYGLGGVKWHKELAFIDHVLEYDAKARIYLYTDGIIDQPVPRYGKTIRLGHVEWLNWISQLASEPFESQEFTINERLATMFAYHEQRDDITIVGIGL
ncbi:MAG: SpoIIE family protein phosphatase [Candidatus Cloacimonas sp.]|jgi:serine phosphatase RsbU (regulator of sigma subunit)|nr:SpoIIE family protein phosphatase [Candidatus Cloacimonas sp.]